MENLLYAVVALIFSGGLFTASAFLFTYAKKNKEPSLFYITLYLFLFAAALQVLFSDRDFFAYDEFIQSTGLNYVVIEWVVRLSSFLIMLASAERGIAWLLNGKLNKHTLTLTIVLLLCWLFNCILPYLVLANYPLRPTYLYTIIFALGLLYASSDLKDSLLKKMKNTVFLFCLFSLLLIFFVPHKVMDTSYYQGYIPGLPRLFGLAPHATQMATCGAILLFLCYLFPYENRKVHFLSISLAIIVIVFSQSKSILLGTLVGGGILFLYQEESKRKPRFFKFFLFTVFCVSTFLFLSMFFNLENEAYRAFSPKQLYNITSLTGRDIIWDLALQEFYKSPILGYGGDLFSPEYREIVGYKNATHGHNLFIDALGRAGILGFLSYTILFLLLIFYSFKYSVATKGLSVALFTILFFYSLSSVTINWRDLGTSDILLFSLIIVIGSAGIGDKRLRKGSQDV